MAWSGGVFSRIHNWVTDAAGGIDIEADRHDVEDDNLATGINNCLTKDGQNQATADINFGGNKAINLGAGTAATDSSTIGGAETLANKTLDDVTVSGNMTITSQVLTLNNGKAEVHFDGVSPSTKRITCNDNSGAWNFRGGVAWDLVDGRLEYLNTGDGAMSIQNNFEALDGSVTLLAAPIGIAGDLVDWTTGSGLRCQPSVSNHPQSLNSDDGTWKDLVNVGSTQVLTNKTAFDCDANTRSENDNSTKIATTEYVDRLDRWKFVESLDTETGNPATVETTSISSTAKEIKIIFNEVTQSQSSTYIQMEMGTSGGYLSSYQGTAASCGGGGRTQTLLTALLSNNDTSALTRTNGIIHITKLNGSDRWIYDGNLSHYLFTLYTTHYVCAGQCDLGGTLDRLRFSLSGGTWADNSYGGTIEIWERL